MTSNHPLKSKKLLISGGSGYLGTNLVSQLRDVSCQIVRLGRFRGKTPREDLPWLKNCVGDVREREVWEKALSGIDFVFHFAAQTSVYVANQDPSADLQANVMPMLHLLEVCREKDWKPTVLFSGTVTQAGVPQQLPVDEAHPDLPITVYDTHKLMAETYLKLYTRLGVVRGAVLRLANVYGPGPKSSQPDRGILNQIVGKALRGESLHIYGEGQYQRDYIYVDDVSSAFVAAAANIDRINGQHFVIGSGQGHTILEAFELVTECVALKTGQQLPITSIDPPAKQSPIEMRNFVADTRRFTQATGWKPKVSLAEGIDRTIKAHQESLST